MSERYEGLFSLGENLYSKESPVLICAGRLLKDHQTGKKLAQIKYKNICAKQIASLTVRLSLADAAGRPVGEVVTHTYSDLSVDRDKEFGSKAPIYLNDPEVCGFDVSVTEVIFGDRSVWTAPDRAEYRPLIGQKKLPEALEEEELVKQYQIRFGKKCAFYPAADRDLWRCACGALNRENEPVCHSCDAKQAELFTLDMESLKKDRDERLEAERQQREADKLEQERMAIAAAKKRKRYIVIASSVFAVFVAFLIVLTTVIIPNHNLKKARALIASGDYGAAQELLDKQNNNEEVLSCKYDLAMALIDAEEYDIAYSILERIGKHEAVSLNRIDRAIALIDSSEYSEGYHGLENSYMAHSLLRSIHDNDADKELIYNRANALINEENYAVAYVLLDDLDYKDSSEIQSTIKHEYQMACLKKAEIGACVNYGMYMQSEHSSDMEDIEWIVLEKKKDKALIISKKALDCMDYNDDEVDVTWETCSLRKWLNEIFINTAFSSEEQEAILSVKVPADKNPKYDTDPGNNTTDKLFLLSITEVNKYFSSDNARRCYPTDYTSAQSLNIPLNGCDWWLRSPGWGANSAACVEYDGRVDSTFVYSRFGGTCVRPAMWISLD